MFVCAFESVTERRVVVNHNHRCTGGEMPHTRFDSHLIVICSGHSLEWDVVGIHKHVGCDGVIGVVFVRV